MISYHDFERFITALQQQDNYDTHINAIQMEAFGCNYLEKYNNQFLHDAIINYLKDQFNDNDSHSLVEYWIYELNYGRKYRPGCYKFYQREIDISSILGLYDELVRLFHHKNETVAV